MHTLSTSNIFEIKKRNSTRVQFNPQKIAEAILKAMKASGEGDEKDSKAVTLAVIQELEQIKSRFRDFIPDVEGIQDLVEKTLITMSYPSIAKSYILYREKRSVLRKKNRSIPEHIQALMTENCSYFRLKFNEFVYLRTYARWIEEEARRETWVETVNRYFEFMREKIGDKLTVREYAELKNAVLTQQVMPSMRLMQFAGKAANSTQVCVYNCSYIAPQSIQDFAEVMYVLMCGTGVGFSVEDQNVQKLPQIQFQTNKTQQTFIIPDCREGWSDAIKIGMQAWYDGYDLEFDFSQCRPQGARLKTFGGKSSGPEPLRGLLLFIKNKILKKQGSRLANLDVHDILCKMGETVVTGGVRRSAMISLSDLENTSMRDAKTGQFYLQEPQRMVANNSAVYKGPLDHTHFLEEWISIMKSGSGERGIFNRESLIKTLPHRRLEYLATKGEITGDTLTGFLGTNPCGEIILRSKQFCNLTEVIARPDDTEESLTKKIRWATILGTYQATLTDFPYLSPEWKKNCEEERLLGVSISGQWDCETLRNSSLLASLKAKSIDVNLEYSRRFLINPSTAITCVKPSGNVSQLVDCASGLHPRFAPYYIRRVRIASTDALFQLCKSQDIPYSPEVGQTFENATTYVLEFPVKSPEGSIFQNEVSALTHLEYWKTVKHNFTEHNPSVTIYVGENEWIDVGHWVYKNWDIIGGLTFLPRTDHVYSLAPYEEITKEHYEELAKKIEKLDFSSLIAFETSDSTDLKKELACSGSNCEL